MRLRHRHATVGALLRLGGLGAAVALPSCGVPVAHAQAPAAPIYREDFEGEFVAARVATGSPSRVAGQIPAGWTEDSGYPGADVSVRYSRIADAAAGKGALRIETERVTAGNSGLRRDNLRLPPKTFLKLRVTARSANGTGVELILRTAAPHKAYWNQRITPGPEWKTYEFVIPPLAAADDTAQFLLIGGRPMQVDVDDLSLTAISDDEVGAGFQDRGNLLPHGSFPAGLVAPWVAPTWTYRRENYRPDPPVPGPSGLPALRIQSEHLANLGQPYFESLLQAPFAGKPNAIHTVSAYLKGERDGQVVKLRLEPPEETGPAYVKAVTLSKEWKRYEFSVKLPYTPKNYYLAGVSSNGHTPERRADVYWVDQMQVEVGEKATPFRRPAPVEVALAPPRNLGLHFEGEPLEVEATVFGDVKTGAALAATLYDASGAALPVAPRPLKPGLKAQKVAFRLPRGKELPFGYYRFAAQVRPAGGAGDASILQEIALCRVRRPRKRDVFAPESPFGVHVKEDEAHIRLVQDLGFKWVRTWAPENMVWSEVERPDGAWDWSRQDRAVKMYRDHKFSILGVLGTGPARYSDTPDYTGWSLWSAKVADRHLPDYQEYARRIGARYKGVITEWETHNETDLPSYFFKRVENGKKVGGTGAEFARQHEAAYRGLKAADPNIRVWWNFAWARPPETVAFAADATKAGIWQHVDGFSYHQYNGNFHAGPGNAVEQRVDQVHSVIPAERKGITVWNSEGGFWPNEIRDLTPQVPPFIAQERNAFFADWLVRYYVSTFAKGTEKFFLFDMSSGGYRPGHELLNDDGSVSEMLIAFSNLAWHLEGKKFARRVPLANGLNAYLFSDGKDSVAVLISSNAGRLTPKQAPAGVTARDALGNDLTFPVRIGDGATYWSGAGRSPDNLERALRSAFGAQ